MEYTQKMGLKMPMESENFDINDFNHNTSLIEKAFSCPEEIPLGCNNVLYYGTGTKAPATEAEVKALQTSLVATVQVGKGRYILACVYPIKRIRDRNGLDCTDDFIQSRVGMYYCYFYAHTATVPMEFTLWLNL